jgi:hypothetical protein
MAQGPERPGLKWRGYCPLPEDYRGLDRDRQGDGGD